MNKYLKFILFFIFICMNLSVNLSAQTEQSVLRAAKTGKSGVSKDEIVSFRSDVPYRSAIQLLSEMAKKLEKKILIDRSPMRDKTTPININIESMYWRDALELILRSNQLWYNDFPEYMEILSLEDMAKQTGETKETGQKETGKKPSEMPTGAPPIVIIDTTNKAIARQREITISSVFFKLDRTKLAQSGIDFKIFRGRDLNLGVQFTGASYVATPVFSATLDPTKNKKLSVDINTAINMFETDQLGEIISRPEVTVRSGNEGRIQIGRDFSVKEKDFSGNTVERFYPTGTILTVTPKVITVDSLEFIDLKYQIVRSSVTIGEASTFVDKTEASGTLSLLNGEESYVGGMYDNEENSTRQGIPYLKDLPWWVFGLRYLFGYDAKSTTRSELIVLIKADFLPLVPQRAIMLEEGRNLIQEKLQNSQDDFQNRTTIKKP